MPIKAAVELLSLNATADDAATQYAQKHAARSGSGRAASTRSVRVNLILGYRQPVEHPTEHPVEHPTEQPVEHPFEQPIEHPELR